MGWKIGLASVALLFAADTANAQCHGRGQSTLIRQNGVSPAAMQQIAMQQAAMQNLAIQQAILQQQALLQQAILQQALLQRQAALQQGQRPGN
jgi:hypothetical protein